MEPNMDEIKQTVDNKVNTEKRKKIRLDDKILKSLEAHYSGERLELVKRQLDSLFELLEVTEVRYQYSKDYRDGIDSMIGLIISGKML